MKYPLHAFSLILLLGLCACGAPTVTLQAAVASPDAYGFRVGKQILKQGGNAVDAAVAMAFSLQVTYPAAGNIGGGGFMLIRHQGRHYLVDCREVAPSKAHRDMYLNEDGRVSNHLSKVGILSVGVPGSVSGMWEAHKRFGKLKWKTVLAPAIALAQNGIRFSPRVAASIQRAATSAKVKKHKLNFALYYGKVKAGELFKQPDLAQTLTRISKHGPKGFYHGKTANLLVATMKKYNGLITHKDLANYKAKWRKPIDVFVPELGYRVLSTPPPSSGGVAFAQLMQMTGAAKQHFENHKPDEAAYVHLTAELMKRVYADRAYYLGDPDFVEVPVDALTANDYCAGRIAAFSPKKITPTKSMKPGLGESEETTHYSVCDFQGNHVAHTTTLNFGYGSGVVVEGAGFLLNNEMDDFSAKPGVPNAYGLLGGTANAIAPGKRMLSSMSPTFVYTEDGRFLNLGTPGGSTIFTNNYQTALQVLFYNKGLNSALAQPKFQHQLYPKDMIFMEADRGYGDDIEATLKNMGYAIKKRRAIGDLHAILDDKGILSAASDPRGVGVAGVISK